MKKAYVGLGSNQGQSFEILRLAVSMLSRHPGLTHLEVSSVYVSSPVGGPVQQDYLNAACCFYSSENSWSLLALLQGIEQAHHRQRDIRWGPRTLDMDLLWHDNQVIQSPELTLPHPRAHLRAFVLKPLLDLNASFLLQQQPLAHWLNAIDPHEQRITQVSQPLFEPI